MAEDLMHLNHAGQSIDSEGHPLKVIHTSESEEGEIERAESTMETPGLTLIQNKEPDS